MKRTLLLAIFFMGGLVLVLVWAMGGFHSKVPAGRTEPPAEETQARKIFKVRTDTGVEAVTVTGTVVSKETAHVSARARGDVVEISADAGDAVKEDQVLLRIDSDELAERVAQAKAALAGAQADLIKAKNDYDRFKVLYEKESIAKKQFDDAVAAHEMAKAAERRAEAVLEEATTMLSYGEVTSPFAGVVAQRFVNVGDHVTAGKPLFTIYMPGTAELVASAGEQYAPYLKTGTPVELRIKSLGLEQKSTIREVVPQRDAKSRTITIKAPLEPAPNLGPGLYGTLTFAAASGKRIMIPAKAVKSVGQLETVLVKVNGAVKDRYVKTGRRTDDKIEVLSGLNPGDEVVVE
ncbi:efflux RND transporter periplasmic adaptor subunit [Thermodesulfobacteriota bacterium]